jgi:hypothetical protein
MKSWVLAAGLLAAAIAPAAMAADIDDDGPPPRSGAYDDPRYSDIYKYPKAPPRQFNPPAPPPGYNDDDDDDGPPRPPSKYSGVPPPQPYSQYGRGPYGHGQFGQRCVQSDQVRDRLTSQGWRDFHGGQQQGGDFVTLRARRPTGRLFELTLHRCSGEIADVRALEPRRFGPYANDGQRRDYDYEDDRSWRERPYAYGGPRRWWNH